jgi:hypothetical protein
MHTVQPEGHTLCKNSQQLEVRIFVVSNGMYDSKTGLQAGL